jgi:hypothetical protein
MTLKSIALVVGTVCFIWGMVNKGRANKLNVGIGVALLYLGIVVL